MLVDSVVYAMKSHKSLEQLNWRKNYPVLGYDIIAQMLIDYGTNRDIRNIVGFRPRDSAAGLLGTLWSGFKSLLTGPNTINVFDRAAYRDQNKIQNVQQGT